MADFNINFPKFEDVMNRARSGGVGAVTDPELSAYYDMGDRSPTAARNILRTGGLNLFNPFANKLASRLSQSSYINNLRNILSTGQEQGPRSMVEEALNSVRSQGLFSPLRQPGAVTNLMGDINSLMRRASQMDPTVSVAQQSMLENLGLVPKSEDQDVDDYLEQISRVVPGIYALGASGMMRPFMRSAVERMLQNFGDVYGAGDMGVSALDYLTGSIGIPYAPISRPSASVMSPDIWGVTEGRRTDIPASVAQKTTATSKSAVSKSRLARPAVRNKLLADIWGGSATTASNSSLDAIKRLYGVQ